jgi:peptidoglycan biosynthesis protein MviN/MurJ (putative lipid II flippase)
MSGNREVTLVAGRLAFARGLARLPSAILPLVIVARYGASPATDGFFLVYAAVMFATNSLAPLLETVVVPFVAESRAESREDAFIKALLLRVLVMFSGISLLLAVIALAWHGAGWTMRPGLGDGWRLLLVLAGIPVLNALASVLGGLLNASEWYMWSAFSGTVRGGVALAIGVALSPVSGLFAFAIGFTAGELAAVGWLACARPARRALQAHRADAKSLRPFWTLYFSAAAGGLANSSKGFVDRFVAAALGSGAVSILEAAERVFLMAMSFVGAPFATVVLSRWSAAHAALPHGQALHAQVRRAQQLALILGAVIAGCGVLLTFSPASQLVFRRFDDAELHTARMALALYLVGAVPYLLGLVTTQAILVIRDSAFVARIAVLIAVLNVPFDIVGAAMIGLPGIAFGSSLLHLVGWAAADLRMRSRSAASKAAQGIAS